MQNIHVCTIQLYFDDVFPLFSLNNGFTLQEAREMSADDIAELLEKKEFQGITVEECEAPVDCSGEAGNMFR